MKNDFFVVILYTFPLRFLYQYHLTCANKILSFVFFYLIVITCLLSFFVADVKFVTIFKHFWSNWLTRLRDKTKKKTGKLCRFCVSVASKEFKLVSKKYKVILLFMTCVYNMLKRGLSKIKRRGNSPLMQRIDKREGDHGPDVILSPDENPTMKLGFPLKTASGHK